MPREGFPVKRRTTIRCYLALLILVYFVRPAHAYLDPSAINALFQFLLAAGIGSLFFVKRIFCFVASFFRKPKNIPNHSGKADAAVQVPENISKASGLR